MAAVGQVNFRPQLENRIAQQDSLGRMIQATQDVFGRVKDGIVSLWNGMTHTVRNTLSATNLFIYGLLEHCGGPRIANLYLHCVNGWKAQKKENELQAQVDLLIKDKEALEKILPNLRDAQEERDRLAGEAEARQGELDALHQKADLLEARFHEINLQHEETARVNQRLQKERGLIDEQLGAVERERNLLVHQVGRLTNEIHALRSQNESRKALTTREEQFLSNLMGKMEVTR